MINTTHPSHDCKYDIENELVNQKDALLQTINDWHIEKALNQLTILADLWIATGYAYKGREVCDRIIRVIHDMESETVKQAYKRHETFRGWSRQAIALHNWFSQV